MSPRTLSLGDRGLDLVLSGGLRWVERAPKHAGSSLLLVGPAGAGKTLLALNLAIHLARQLDGDIAYACIEILPAELEAQLAGQRPDLIDVRVRHRNTQNATSASGITLDVGLLEMGDDPDSFGDALQAFWEDLRAREARPKVLVIDSLIDGYGIGRGVSRRLADAVCKIAARWNVALILLEERAPQEPSPWPFAVDTVLDLSPQADDVGTSERSMRVRKHRFGASDPGPHRWLIDTGVGIRVLPRPGAWRSAWVTWPEASEKSPRETLRLPNALRDLETPNGRDPAEVVMVWGPGSVGVSHAVRAWQPTLQRPHAILDVRCAPQSSGSKDPPQAGDRSFFTRGIWHADMSAHRLVWQLLHAVTECDRAEIPLVLVQLGDLRALRETLSSEEIHRTVGVFCDIMRARHIPVILYETTFHRGKVVFDQVEGSWKMSMEPGLSAPSITSLADISVEVLSDDSSKVVSMNKLIVTDLRHARSATFLLTSQ